MNFSNYFQNRVILVTGGVGAIGVNLVSKLSNLDCKQVIVLDNLSSSYIWNFPDKHNVLFVKGDIRNNHDLKRVFKYNPSIVFHLAAFFANQNSVDYPLINESVNGQGIIELLEYSIISKNIERFVYSNSEGGVYGEDCISPYKEELISLKLGSPYYISKLAGEAYCNYYHTNYGLPICNVRLFNSFGPGEVPGQYRNVIPNFIYWAMQGKQLPLTGDERIARDFVFVEDIVEGLIRGAFYPRAIGEAINIATGKETKIYHLANLINEKLDNKSGVKILKSRKWDSRVSFVGDTQKCENILEFKPRINFEADLDRTISWFKNNWPKIEQSAEFPPGVNSALNIYD
jgi:UDP-glucose 4-epimerase